MTDLIPALIGAALGCTIAEFVIIPWLNKKINKKP